MQLKRLDIHSLPGIEPGFTFEPASAGVNIVTGPNAIGKSSLARALGYLLRGGQRDDPAALSLEAEFETDGSNLRVLRNGSEVAWYRDGNPASPPVLPGTYQTGLHRLSMEHLLTGDDSDSDLAGELRNRLRGGFDLDAARISLGSRYALNEEKNLSNAKRELRQTEGEYDILERQEQEGLPRLDSEIKAAEDAQERLQRLRLGVDLHNAVDLRKSCAYEFKDYPSGMDKLRGDEQERLAKLERKSEELKDRLQDQERLLDAAERTLEETGLQDSGPDVEALEATGMQLNKLGQKVEKRNNARETLTRADAGLKGAQEYFNDNCDSPKLDAQSLGKAEAIAVPLIKAQSKRNELQLKLEQAGSPPDEAEIDKLYDAGSALREWLALTAAGFGTQPASSSRRERLAFWFILAASGLAVFLAGIQQALPAAVAALVALVVAAWGLFYLRKSPTAGVSTDAVRQRFIRTGLDGPQEWTVAAVDQYLRTQIDKSHSTLILQREHAAQAGGIHPELGKLEEEIEKLRAQKQEAAAELGFDPGLPSISPEIFVQNCRQLAEAQNRYVEAKAGLDAIERDIARDISSVRVFLGQWHRADAATLDDADADWDVHQLQASFQNLKRRSDEANGARRDITRCKEGIQTLEKEIKENRADIGTIFTERGLKADDTIELDRRLGLLGEWKTKQETFQSAKLEEKRVRALLETNPDIIKDVDEDKLAKLQNELTLASDQAEKYTELVRQQAEITTRLKDAGADHNLSRAQVAVDVARTALQDKLEQAWLHEATELLINDVEQTFSTENEPEVLSHARALFQEITANAFDLQLDKEGAFIARDLKQEETRNLDGLSSGTRMQLLLALRLAWIRAQEQGGETLPLFLDEALTTSDEERFAVMANSLERLAGTEGRQIFYLAARRHERALWEYATGSEPPIIDLAAVRFPQQAYSPQDYKVTPPPSLPAPEGRDPEAYASVLGVPLMNPRLEPGMVHLFHLLRDDLVMLHQFINNWRIISLGQLEALLESNAGPTAVTDAELRERLRQRCAVVRNWTALWRRGRGWPVNRIALEQSGVVSDRFIDRVEGLSEEVKGDGEALVQALRTGQVSGFRTSKIEELQSWLSGEGYTDEEDILSVEGRRQQTLQQTIPATSEGIEDVNMVVTWLESAIAAD